MPKKRVDLAQRVDSARSAIRTIADGRLVGRVASVRGLVVDVAGLRNAAAIGDRVEVVAREGVQVAGEVIGFHDDRVEVMTYHPVDGLAGGMPVGLLGRQQSHLFPSDCWLGRVIDPLGNPIDRSGPMLRGPKPLALRAVPPDANIRARVGPPIELGVRALDLFATCREGQRMGLFAGSGVGKSTLLSMLTRGTACDVVVLALVGERGREVREFIEDDLGPEGLARAVVVVATSDTPPLMRRQCAYTAATVAEFFRDQGRSVLLLMDSVTRFCLALREIGLSLGEPPATRGYPPSVFAELPKLLERAGPGLEAAQGSTGQITGLFTVLVEGDDHNEPVADAVRGILDGHIVMERRIAESGRYPAIDVLRSLSRLASTCLDEQQTALVRRARSILSLHADMIDMVRLGAYRAGTDAAVDEAIRLTPAIEATLRQGRYTTAHRLARRSLTSLQSLARRMARDPLQALATLRRLAVDAARQELAKCENYQVALSSHISACDTAITNNELIDHDPVDHAPVAVSHSYIDKLNRRSNLLRQYVPIAQTKTDVARNALSLARLAEKAIKEITLKRDQVRSAEACRHAQHALDDMARGTLRVWRQGS